MAQEHIGNRITDNAANADDGADLIRRALREIEGRLGWHAADAQHLFSGVYYDSKKVGSFIVPATNGAGSSAVLKLQLRPLPFDEGRIIRHISERNRSKRIRLPKVLADIAWNQSDGYGFLIFEDLRNLPDLWSHASPKADDLARHKDFLQDISMPWTTSIFRASISRTVTSRGKMLNTIR